MHSLKAKLTGLTLLPILISFTAFYFLSLYPFARPLETAPALELEAKAKPGVQAICLKPLRMDLLARTVRQVLDAKGES